MIENSKDILHQHPVRKTRKQKKLFREDVIAYAEKYGYSCKIEKGSLGARNLIIGSPETAKHLITAHYDTCAALPIPNMIFPCNFGMFLLTQLGISLLILMPGILAFIVACIFVNNPVYRDLVLCVMFVLTILLTMYGPANRNNANDNTSGVVTLLEILKSYPVNSRDQVCFVLFDLEEAGLVGSSSYHSVHKDESHSQMIWNLDCVGDGDYIVFFPSKRVKKDDSKMAILDRCCTDLASKSISICRNGFAFYPSDQKNFPYGIGIAAFNKNRFGLFISKIHTRRDVILDETNVNILRAAIISAITCDGVQ